MPYQDALFDSLSELLKKMPPHEPIGVAVSGGADSLALVLALQEVSSTHKIVALTVDHNIRKESTQEALFVHQLLSQFKIEHHILTNHQTPPSSRLEEWARTIRYNLLCDFCHQHKIFHLCLAHHQQDQAETFLIRLAHATGLTGLCSIQPVSQRLGITLLRPLLNVNKKHLTDFLSARHIQWIEDPMNQNVIYERVKWRQFIPQLCQNGFSLDALNKTLFRLQRANQALDAWTENFLKTSLFEAKEGYLRLDKKLFESLPDEIKLRVLNACLSQINPTPFPVSLNALENMLTKKESRYTLGGCLIVFHKKGIFIAKEPIRIQKKTLILKNTPTKWDRFLIKAPFDLFIEAKEPQPHLKNIPFTIQKTFPHFTKKGLEKISEIDYKDWDKYQIDIRVLKD